MKYLNIVLCAFMVLFAAVQYNDPDAILWIVIYLVAAVCAGVAGFRLDVARAKTPLALLGASAAAFVAGTVYYWPTTPGFWRQDIWWETETAREGMGMMIATVVVAIAFYTAWSARSKDATQD